MTEPAVQGQAVETAQTDQVKQDGVPDNGAPPASLLEDVEALVEDGKTYVEAELNYQKARAGFAAGRGKWIAIFGVVALIALFLGAIALTLGLLVGLTTSLGIWGATAVVAGGWLLVVALCVFGIVRSAKSISSAFKEDDS